MSNEEIKDYANKIKSYNWSKPISDDNVRILYSMLLEIKDYIFYKKPTSKFYQCCADENWEMALYVGDNQNKQLLSNTDFFQNFVKKVKTSSEYISKMRSEKLNNLGI